MLQSWGWALLKFPSLVMRFFCSLIFPLAPHWLVNFRASPGTWLLAYAVGCGKVTWLRRLDHGTNRTLALIAGETLRFSWCRLVARPHRTCQLVVPCQKIRFIPRANLGCAARRRQQRVPPRRRLLPPYGELLPGGDLPGGELPARPAVPARHVGDPVGSRGNSHRDLSLHRDRSRSRDDSEDAEARAFAVHRGLSYPRRRRTSSPHSSPEH